MNSIQDTLTGRFIGSRNYDLVNIKEAAQILSVSVQTVRRLQWGRYIPFVRVSGSLRFARKDLENYIENGRVDQIVRSKGF